MRLPHTLLLVAALMLGSFPALAQCLPVADFAAQLASNFREKPAFRAIQDGFPIVIFASPAGTFTVLVIVQSGKTACVLAGGTGWQNLPPPPDGKAS